MTAWGKQPPPPFGQTTPQADTPGNTYVTPSTPHILHANHHIPQPYTTTALYTTPHLWTEWMAQACENLTFPITRPVMILTSFFISWAVPEETERLVERLAVYTLAHRHPDVFIHELFQSLDVLWNSSGQFIVIASCLVTHWTFGVFIKHHYGHLNKNAYTIVGVSAN